MKRKSFLKSLSVVIFVMAMIFGAPMVFTSCEDLTPALEPCEQNNTGTFIVQNTTGYTVWVDVNNIDERKLYHGGQTTYYNVPAGTNKLYIDLGDGWQYNTQYLSACETITYTWYLYGKKSTNQVNASFERDGTIVVNDSDLIRDFDR